MKYNFTKYNFTASETYAKSLGIFLLPDKVVEFDQLAAAHGFTQAQVDVAMQMHIRHIAWLLTPKSYNWKQRFALAFHFLFRSKL